MRVSIRLLAALAALALLAAACGGSDDDGGEEAITFDGDGGADGSDNDGSSDDDGSSGDDDGASDDATGDDGGSGESGGSSGSGDFMTVFGLPPGDSVETDYAPYEFREDEFGTSESVTFEVTGATLEEIIAFYQETVPAMGYVVDEPLELGESLALNISDPNNPGTSAVIQAGETQGVITVHHNINRLNPPEDDDDTDTSGSSSSGSEGDAGEPLTDAESTSISINGPSVDIDWAALTGTPFYAPANQASDPFFHIHTIPDVDGFFFSLEMYTEWGQAWTGETGGFEISCSDPATSTGICPYLDPDGPGPLPVLGGDFMTTGQIVINELGPDGYDLMVGPVIFSDGTVVNPFTMTG